MSQGNLKAMRKAAPEQIERAERLTPDDVSQIVQLVRSGERPKQVAERYGLNPATVYDLLKKSRR